MTEAPHPVRPEIADWPLSEQQQAAQELVAARIAAQQLELTDWQQILDELAEGVDVRSTLSRSGLAKVESGDQVRLSPVLMLQARRSTDAWPQARELFWHLYPGSRELMLDALIVTADHQA